MIRLNDALILALTKLRTRRTRTLVTVIIASLLFGVLVFATFVIEGFSVSFQQFNKGTFSDRYLVQATVARPNQLQFDSLPDTVKKRANDIYNQTIIDKKAAAKKLGIEYDPATEQKPVIDDIAGSGDAYYNLSSPSVVKAVNEYNATRPSANDRFQALVVKYHPKAIHMTNVSTIAYDKMKMIVEGKEDFAKPDETSHFTGDQSVSMGWRYDDASITAPFLLSDAQLARQKNKQALPIIAPIAKVEKALGLNALPKSATSADRLERLRFIRNNADKATFTACYRNSVSQLQIDSGIAVSKEIEQNKNNKDYQRPAFQYGLPAEGECQAAPIVRDVRNKQDKQLALKQDQFDQQFGEEITPDQQLVSFRVVGLSPQGMTGDSFSALDALFSTLAGSTLNGQWVVPNQLLNTMPNKADYVKFTSNNQSVDSFAQNDSVMAVLEFASAAEARQFIDEESCANEYCEDGTNYAYFGSNSVLINDIKKQITKGLAIAASVVAGIAALIMMGMTWRVISDSRRETAVFRAIGARRNDIRAIYVGYTLMLSVIIALMSLLLGLIAAMIFDAKFAPELTVQGYLTYIFAPDDLTFHLLSPWWFALGVLAAVVIIVGFIGMLLPLARNLARSPIKDMRDDS